MSFKTIIGQVARGDDFFHRPNITNEIWRKLESGSNLLLVAPRRVGKTSILFNLLDATRENNIVIYYISESVNNENEFYQKLFSHIVERVSTIEKYKAKFKSVAKEFLLSIDSIGKDGIKIRHDNTISYYQEIFNLMRKIDLGKSKLIILIDEFAQAVENILQDEGEGAAIHFLQSNRVIRLEPIISTKLQFVYAGSIGLENIVNKINAINTIDDLAPIKVPPLSKTEAEIFSNKIIGSSITFNNEAFDYLLNKIEWWIPYHFQIILDEVKKNLLEEDGFLITKETIDKSISVVLEQRIYFELWVTRLRKAYKGAEFSFIKELLNITSQKHKITTSEIYDLTIKYKLENTSNNLVNALKYDGYINNNDDPKIYRFNSPLLREWWYRNGAK